MDKTTRFYELFKPKNYEIFLDIDRKKKIFHGKTIVTGEANAQTIALHQKDLAITEVLIDNKPTFFELDEALDALILHTELGQHVIEVTYSAKLTDTMMGIYPSYYELDGETKQLIGTQFETDAARQAFVCVDEPAAKATFSLSLKFDEHPGETILSNMPETSCVAGVHHFETTKKMSTYLVAFAFGELNAKTTKTNSGVTIGAFSTKAHASKELDFALDVAKRSIEFFEAYYETPYPLPHSFQLALPDFSAGAMENWGLVTYREALLLVDPDNTTLPVKQRVALVIAHELAHQWFGDLVTMQWWDDLWLNESFANMMMYVAIDALFPEWHIWETFQISETPLALERDATAGVQPVHVEVSDPAEIDSLFDGAIVYAKGSRLLVMVRALIGDEALRVGLKNYFAKFQYANATGADLWDALEEASGRPIGQIMRPWLDQAGYPVVSAKLTDGALRLEQQQFFNDKTHSSKKLWQIPLKSNYAALPALMSEKTLVVADAKQDPNMPSPFLLNLKNEAHYIVKYDETLRHELLEHVEQLDAITAFQLLQDNFLLAKGQQLDYDALLELLPSFKARKAFIVNDVLYEIFFSLKRFVDPDAKVLKNFGAALCAPHLKRLGLTKKAGEPTDDTLLRPLILQTAVFAKDHQTVEALHELFKQNTDAWQKLAADIRAVVLKNEVVNFGTPELLTTLLKEYQTATDGSYKTDLQRALVAFTTEEELSRLIQNFKNAELIKPQDLRMWFAGVLANPVGKELAWTWFKTEWPWLEETVGGDMEFASYLTVIGRTFASDKDLSEFTAFFAPMAERPDLAREIKMDQNAIKARISLINTQKDKVSKFLQQYV